MLQDNALDHFITLTTSEDIKMICQPLFNHLGIEYFTFHRIYDDATTIRLSTYLEWSKHYIYHNYFSLLNLDHYPCTKFDYEYILWNDYLKSVDMDKKISTIIEISMQDFSIFNSFTILKLHKKYCDSFNFGFLNKNENFNNTLYLSNISFFEKFTNYFLNKASLLILKAYKTRLPTQYSQKYSNNLDTKSNLIISNKNNINHRSSISEIHFKNELNFTPRELQCLVYFRQGLSAKETARLIACSHRTVEYYLSNIRRKVGSNKTINTIDFIDKLLQKS